MYLNNRLHNMIIIRSVHYALKAPGALLPQDVSYED